MTAIRPPLTLAFASSVYLRAHRQQRSSASCMIRGCSGITCGWALRLSSFSSSLSLGFAMATIQGHPFYDQEKAAFEQDPANAVLLALAKDSEGLAGLARDIIRDAPDPVRRPPSSYCSSFWLQSLTHARVDTSPVRWHGMEPCWRPCRRLDEKARRGQHRGKWRFVHYGSAGRPVSRPSLFGEMQLTLLTSSAARVSRCSSASSSRSLGREDISSSSSSRAGCTPARLTRCCRGSSVCRRRRAARSTLPSSTRREDVRATFSSLK